MTSVAAQSEQISAVAASRVSPYSVRTPLRRLVKSLSLPLSRARARPLLLFIPPVSVLALLYRDAWAPRASDAFTTASSTTTTTTTTTTSTAIRIADLTLRPPLAHPPKHQENYRRRPTLVILRHGEYRGKQDLPSLLPPLARPSDRGVTSRRKYN